MLYLIHGTHCDICLSLQIWQTKRILLSLLVVFTLPPMTIHIWQAVSKTYYHDYHDHIYFSSSTNGLVTSSPGHFSDYIKEEFHHNWVIFKGSTTLLMRCDHVVNGLSLSLLINNSIAAFSQLIWNTVSRKLSCKITECDNTLMHNVQKEEQEEELWKLPNVYRSQGYGWG